MNKMVCEMCNSNDLVKQDGMYVCQHCGIKYSVEEARKMMVEGTVQIDNSLLVQKYLYNARGALVTEDWDEVEKYYNMVKQNEPTNIEAIFFSAYGKARLSLTSNDIYKRQAVFKVLCNSISILDSHYDPAKCEELSPVIEQIVREVVDIMRSGFIYTETTDSDGFKSDDKSKTYTLFVSLAAEMHKTLNNIAKKIPVGHEDALLVIRKGQLELANIMSTNDHHIGLTNQSKIKNCRVGIEVVQKIKELDPSFVSPVDFNTRLETIEKEENRLVIWGGLLVILIAAGFGWLIYEIVKSIINRI